MNYSYDKVEGELGGRGELEEEGGRGRRRWRRRRRRREDLVNI